MDWIKTFNFVIALLFTVCYFYQALYIFVPLLPEKQTAAPVKKHRFAILISARNEARVLPQLLDSIRRQDYDPACITVFVVADNCTDDTADVCRRAGAVVYTRFDTQKIGKGYALGYLTRQIMADYPAGYFDGYFIFDADNLLAPDYISRMNEVFCRGYKIVTGYRNSKNYGDSWVSAFHGLWFLRESQFLNRPRMRLGTGCAVGGTGFLFAGDILQKHGGWPFCTLTEDLEFTAVCALSGDTIGYCHDAILYDEQPVTMAQSWRQRLRWAKGTYQVLGKYGLRLFSGIFSGGGFACFDILMSLAPAAILTVCSIVINAAAAFAGLLGCSGLSVTFFSVFETLVNLYLVMLAMGAITLVTQWKRICTSTGKKLLYLFSFPFYMITFIPIACVALFLPVQWKPIRHDRALTLEQVLGGRAENSLSKEPPGELASRRK